MKVTQEVHKENKNANVENIEKDKFSQDEKRHFGKDIKNSQIGHGQGKMNKGKKPKKEDFCFKEQITQNCKENSVNKNEEHVPRNSLSISQIVQNDQGRLSEVYKNVSLANENVLRQAKVEPSSFEGGEQLIKIGSNYVRTSSSLMGLKASMENRKSFEDKYKDPQKVEEYTKEIFSYLKRNEQVNAATANYMGEVQRDITDKMRAVLIDWLIDVHLKFKLTCETLYLTVNLIDRYLAKVPVSRTALQLVGVGAMLIASKYEEIYAPEVRDFVYISDKTYSRNEIIHMEYSILSTLNFDILQISPYTFLKRFHDVVREPIKVFYLAQFILEFSFVEYKMVSYNSAEKAASCLMTSRKILKLTPSWPTSLTEETGYTEKDIKHCVKDLCRVIELLPRITLKSCINKFALAKYLEVSKTNFFNNI